MNRSRITGDLVSQNNIFVDIANDRVGIGSTIPTHKIDVSGNIKLHDQTGHNNHITYKSSGPAPHIHLPTGPLANLARTPYIGFGDRGDSSGDFKIYHDHYNAHLKLNANFGGGYGAGLGGLFLSNHSTSGVIGIQGANGSGSSQNSIFIPAGATAGVKIYQAGQLRFETVGYGVTVHGTTETQELNVTGVSTFAGNINGKDIILTDTTPAISFIDNNANSDYKIIADNGVLSFADITNNANRINIFSNGNVKVLGNLDALAGLDVTGDITGTGDLTLTDTTADSAAGPEFKLFRNSASPADADYLGQIKFAGESDTGVERNYAKITGKILDASNGTEDGILEFAHIKAGSQVITGRWRSDSLQLLNSTNFSVAGTSEFSDLATFTKSGSALRLNDGSIQRYGNADADYFQYYDGSGDIAYLSVGSSRTFRITTDDFNVYGANNTEQIIRAQKDGAVTLFYDNSAKFATTSTGATVTGSLTLTDDLFLSDANVAYFGTNNDLRIYHSGTHGYIKNTTNNLYIMTTNSEYGALFYANGGVELRYDNVKKFETTSDGTTFSGSALFPDNQRIKIGGTASSPDLQIYHDGSHSYISEVGTGHLYFGASGYRFNNAAQTESIIQADQDGAVNLYHNGTNRFATTSTGFEGFGTEFKFSDAANTNVIINADTDNSNEAHHPSLSFKQDGTTQVLQIGVNGDTPTFTGGTHNFAYVQIGGHSNVGLEIATGDGGSQTKRLTITSSGHVLPNGTNTYDLGSSSNRFKDIFAASSVSLADDGRVKLGNGNDLQIYHNQSSNTNEFTSPLSTNFRGKNLYFYVGANVSSESAIMAYANAAVEIYNNNVKKFETTSTGFQGFGTQFKFSDAGDTNVIINADTDNSNEAHHPSLSFIQDGSTHVLDIGVNGDSPDYTGGVHNNAYIRCGGHSNVGLEIATGPGGGSASVKRLTIDHNGHLKAGTDSAQDIGTNTTRWRNIYADTYYGDGSNLSNITSTTINNNANNRIITGSGTANTLEGESNLTFDGSTVDLHGGQSSSSNYMVLRIEDTYHRKIQFAEATSSHAVGTYGGFIGYDAANNLTTIGTNHNSTSYNGITITRDGGYVLNPTCPKFSAYMANTYSWNNQIIVWDSELYDIGSNYNTSNGKFTAPVTGYYVFGVKFRAGTGFGQFGGMWTRNSSTYKRAFGQNSYAQGDCIVAVDVIPMSANDTMGLRFEGSHGGATGGAHENGFWGYLLG